MKLDVQPLEDHQVKVIAEMEPAALEEFMRRAARKISRETRIPGFRPGKAPYDMVKRHVGEEALRQQAVEDLIDEYYPKILDEAQIKPGATGSLEEIVSVDPPKFSFIIPLEPTVELGGYKDIRLEYALEAVKEADVDEFIQRLRTNYATAEPVERPAEDGDLVYVKFSGKLTKPAEGEDENVFPERPAQFIIGNDVIQNRDWPYPGFNESLKGLSAGDEKTAKHKYTKDEKDEALRGKTVEFKVTVQSIKALHLPELNDEFAQTVGQFETVADLRKAVQEQLEVAKKDETDDAYYTSLIDKVIEGATIKYPPQVLEHEVEHMMEHVKEDVGRQGMELDAYFKMIDKNREKYIEEEIRPAARRRLARSLVMDELAKVEEVKLEEDDYNQAITATVSQLQSQPKPRKTKEKVNPDLVNNMTMNELSRKFNIKVLERMKAIATGHGDDAAKPAEAETPVEGEATGAKKPAAPRKPRAKAKPKTE
ncbi:MAG: trigger factor [Anaerolinea sp.]|nr:trigger factor [Anaerolinea sp.]